MKKVVLLSITLLLISCGQQNQTPIQPDQNISPQVMNGTLSKLGDRPYQAAILLDGKFLCNGTIIAKDWILTAAHCVAKQNSGTRLSVRVGSLNAHEGGQVIKVDSYILHPNYIFGHQPENDLALVTLSCEIEFNENVAAAALPTKNVEAKGAAPNRSLVLSGWGHYDREKRQASELLREASLKVINNTTCQKEYKGRLSDLLTKNTMCGAPNSKDQTGCFGDDGSPFVKKLNNQFYVFGSVSWGRGWTWGDHCVNSVVFTRVANFQPWITKETGIQPKDDSVIERTVYEGTLKHHQSNFHPSNQGFHHKGGTLKADLLFDKYKYPYLYLQKKEGLDWVSLDTDKQSITYYAPPGIYRWEVFNKSELKYKLVVSIFK